MKKLLLILISSFLFINSMALPLAVGAAPNPPPPTPAPSASPAPSTWYNQDFPSWYGKVYDDKNPAEIFGERYTAAQVQWVIYGLWGYLINTITGPKNAPVVQCFLNNTIDLNVCSEAIAKLVADLPKDSNIAGTYPSQKQSLWSAVFADRQLSGVTYVKQKVQNFSLVPVARAQTVGFGFDALAPVRDMWTAFRDIAFGFFVIIAVVFSFMIMFRVKLSPQTVISVQSALPKIVISLVLVTFSYAIAGFLVDLMYVVIGLISLVVNQIYTKTLGFSIPSGATAIFNMMTLGQPIGFVGQATGAWGVFVLAGIFFVMLYLPVLLLLLAAIGLLAATGVGAPIALILSLLIFLLYIVAIIVAIWTGVKVIWSLLKAFVNILLLTIFAPIQIALGTVVPSLAFDQWLKSFVSNLAVFVVTGTLMIFSFLFIIQGILVGFTDVLKDAAKFVIYLLNPLLGTLASNIPALQNHGSAYWPPLLGTSGGISAGLLFFGVAFVLFTLIPKANEIIQGLMSGKPFAYGTAIGEAFGGVGAVYGQTAGPVVETIRKGVMEKSTDRYVNIIKDEIEKRLPKPKARTESGA